VPYLNLGPRGGRVSRFGQVTTDVEGRRDRIDHGKSRSNLLAPGQVDLGRLPEPCRVLGDTVHPRHVCRDYLDNYRLRAYWFRYRNPRQRTRDGRQESARENLPTVFYSKLARRLLEMLRPSFKNTEAVGTRSSTSARRARHARQLQVPPPAQLDFSSTAAA